MPVFSKIQRFALHIVTILAGTAVVTLALVVMIRLIAHSPRAEAASVIYYPNFCLGGWKYPQHASGPAAVSATKFDAAAFTPDNSAYLESSVASQLFCGYFSVRNAKNPPKKAVISFNWSFAFSDDSLVDDKQATSTTESYTSTEGYISVPAAGLVVPVASTTATSTFPMNTPVGSLPATPQNVPANPSPTSTPPSSTEQSQTPPGNEPGTTEVPVVPNSVPSATPSSNPDATTPASPEPAPAAVTTPAPSESSSAPAPAATDAPQSFNAGQDISRLIASLVIQQVHAAEPDTIVQSPLNANSFKDFLEVSYSLDGIRWTAIGRVNKENWKGYKVEIPVTSWDEVKRLQIMVSVLPTIDQKPDIYLDSMSMRAEYDQTVAELAAQGFAAVSNAVDTLIGDGNDTQGAYDIIPDAPKSPQSTEIRTKKLQFSSTGKAVAVMHDTFDGEGRVSGKIPSKRVNVSPAEGASSLTVSGTCDKKYFVILTYRGQDDYLRKPRSFVVNRAHECSGGNFSFDLASLSPETNGGAQYLVVGEQGETGTWSVTSDIFPILIEATTTVKTIYQ